MVRKTSSLFQLPLLVAIVTLWSAAWALGNQNDQAPTVRLGKRNSPSDTDSHEQELYNYLDDLFTSDVRDTVGRLQSAQYRPLLVHTSDMQSDVLVFVQQNAVNVSATINTSVYQNLKVISHLPVSAVTLLIPDLFANNGTLTGSHLTDDTRRRLVQFDDAVWNVSNQMSSEFPDQVWSAQMEIIESVGNLLDSILNHSDIVITLDTLKKQFEPINQHLKTLSEDAVRDYLISLNQTLSALIVSENITEQEWEDLIVILSLDPFAGSGSFLAQYYTQLLDANSSRLIFSCGHSSSQQTPLNCTVDTQNNSIDSLLSLSNFLLQQFVNEIFNSGNSSIHSLLSQAASKIICNDVVFPSCAVPETDIVIYGFESRIERSYIVLMVFFGGFSIMFGIVLACIVYEDRVMANEIKAQGAKESSKIEGPNVFTPKSSNEDAGQSITEEHVIDI